MIILGLGSNVGDRVDGLDTAVQALSSLITDIRPSRKYESAALLPEGAPADWNMPYLNMVITGECALAPLVLLSFIKSIELDLGRQARGHWAPREMDIDILAMDGVTMQTPVLTLPHPHMLTRDFVLLPLAEIAPDWRYPGSDKPIAEIVAAKGFALGEGLRVYD